MDGRIGVYVGGGVVVKATPKWQGGVQCSTLANTAGAQKLPGTAGCRRWTKHGKLPWVDYSAESKTNDVDAKEEEKSMPIYARLPNVPASYRPTIQKVMERGGLGGYSNPDPNSLEDNLLNIDETYCRVMTTLDRMGILG